VNDADVGGIRWAAPPGTAEDAIPDWLVVGFELRIAWPEGTVTGERPGETSLVEEGFEDFTPALVTESWARHLMANLDEWQARGPRRVTEKFLARLNDPAAEKGLKRGINPKGAALVLEREGERREVPLS
jgi:hypothetical protein